MTLLLALIADQWGMVTTGQAQAAGVSRVAVSRMSHDGDLVQLRHGVYMSPQFPATELDEMRAAWLASDARRSRAERFDHVDQVVVCDESAAQVHGIGDLPNDVVRLNSSRRMGPGLAHASNRAMNRAEWQWVDGLPVTTPRRTLEDLARCGRWDDDQVRAVVDDAVAKGVLTAADAARSRAILKIAPHLAPPASHQSALQR